MYKKKKRREEKNLRGGNDMLHNFRTVLSKICMYLLDAKQSFVHFMITLFNKSPRPYISCNSAVSFTTTMYQIFQQNTGLKGKV